MFKRIWPDFLFGDGGAIWGRVEIKQTLEVWSVFEPLIFAVTILFAEALAAWKTCETDRGKRTNVRFRAL